MAAAAAPAPAIKPFDFPVMLTEAGAAAIVVFALAFAMIGLMT